GTDLPRLEGARNAAGEGQLIQRVDPVRGVVELPVCMAVALLQRVPRAHAQLNRDDVGLRVREMVFRAGKVRWLAVGGEDIAGHIVAARSRGGAGGGGEQ